MKVAIFIKCNAYGLSLALGRQTYESKGKCKENIIRDIDVETE